MANYTIYPTPSGVETLNAIPYKVPYIGRTGQGNYENLQEISAEKMTPLIRSVSTTQFKSGSYTSFLSPLNPMPANTLPCFETSTTIIGSDTFKLYTPHKGYIIGSDSDKLTGSFEINLYAGEYTSDGEVIQTMGVGQVLKVVVYKAAGSTIDWVGSNILNNYLDDIYIAPVTRLEFEVQKLDTGVYQVTNWVTPSIQDRQITTERIVDAAITAAKLAAGAVLASIGAGGINSGYLAPGAALDNVSPGSIPADRLAAGVALANIGVGNILSDYLAAGAALENIADRSITGIKLANDAVDTPQLKNNAVTGDKIATGGVSTDKIAAQAVTAPKLAAGAALSNIGPGGIATQYLTNGAVTANKLDLLATGLFSASFQLFSFGNPYTNWSLGNTYTNIPGVTINVDSSSANAANVVLTFPAAFGLANRGYTNLGLTGTAIINGTSWFRSMAVAANIRTTSSTKLYIGIGDVAVVGERSGSSLVLTQMTGSPSGAGAQVNICIQFPYI